MSAGPYAAWSTDPPWRHKDQLPGAKRGAGRNYRTMSVEEICAIEPPPLLPDAYLFLWRVSSLVEEAYRVVRAWGFVPKSEVVWEKVTKTGLPWFGMGRHVRAAHETAILAVRGRPRPLFRNVRSRFSAQVGEHSAKPEFFYRQVVERLSPGPYVETFSRRERQGWTCIGDIIGSP